MAALACILFFFERGYLMTGLKMELLGISFILWGIAMSMNSFYGMLGGAVGFGVVVGGCFYRGKNKDDK